MGMHSVGCRVAGALGIGFVGGIFGGAIAVDVLE